MLDAIIGIHVVDGMGEFISPAEAPYSESVRVFLLRIDGMVHVFQENARDGYRSCLGSSQVSEGHDVIRRMVPFPQPMTCNFIKRPRLYDFLRNDDVIVVTDERTGLIHYEIGTENFDDYYPCFIASWSPIGWQAEWLAGKEDERNQNDA
jgi:hypothetical protein